ncbi:lipopolysaccharide export system permease protein [Serratia symbiotica str. 'Cinara cedri']|nr:lipopolysaccharide export system permease protein [Serratia symbiotica str. 'Cinara cedri']
MIFSILDRYIDKMIFNAIIMTLFILVSLSSIIKFVDQLRKVGQGAYTVLDAVIFTILSAMKDIEIFFPMAALLGTLLGLGQLATRGELIVMQASGFTRMQIASSVIKISIPLLLLTIAISEWLAPVGQQIALDYRAQQMHGGSLLSTTHGVWAKDNNDFIYIERIYNKKELSGINIYHLNNQHKLITIIYAATAHFKDSVWNLSKVDTINLLNEQQITRTQTLTSPWTTNLTPEILSIIALDPNSLSIRELRNYIQYLKQSGQIANHYQLNMWNKIFLPFVVTVMMLMALSFIFGPLCNVKMGIRIAIGIIFGFFFYVLDKIFGQCSLVYNISPILGALLPSIIFLLISIYMLLLRN